MSDAVQVTLFFLFIVCLLAAVNAVTCWVLRRWNNSNTARYRCRGTFKAFIEVPQDSPNAEMVGGPLDGLLVQLPLESFLSGPSGIVGQEHREDGTVVCHDYELEPARLLPSGLAVCRYRGRLTEQEAERLAGKMEGMA